MISTSLAVLLLAPGLLAGSSATPMPAVHRASSGPAASGPTGTLEIRTEPTGATVLLGTRLLGATPLQVQITPGSYRVTLRREGFEEQSFPIQIIADQLVREVRSLKAAPPASSGPPAGGPPPLAVPSPAPDAASLVVFTEPPGATVYLDDEPLGESDPASGRLVKTRLRPGVKRVRASKAGFEDVSREVEVPRSGAAEVQLALAPSRTALSPLVVAIVATVAAGLFLLARQRLRGGKATPREPSPPTPLPSPASSAGLPGPITDRPQPTGRSPTLQASEAERAKVPEAAEERFGDYSLRETLGRGGMATVYLAERGGELVALKRPHVAFLDDAEFRERFLREAEIGITLHHPNIVRILERGNVQGVPYFTMEFVPGQTLQAWLRGRGALAVREACRIVTQVAEALDYAHLKGIVHRDLKPSNVMVLPDGSARVMDYGIARAQRYEGITATGAFLGTPDYVAPETAEGNVTDARSDLYSLGVLFYELLTGRKPFVGETPFATLRMHVSEAPAPPSAVLPGIPAELEAIVLRLLAKNPDDRYPGAEELLGDLRAYANRAA